MAKQLFGVNYEYTVIDNVAAQTFPTFSAGAHIGYDTVTVVPTFGAAASQDANAFANGTIPDFVATGATTVLNSASTTRLLYKNPS